MKILTKTIGAVGLAVALAAASAAPASAASFNFGFGFGNFGYHNSTTWDWPHRPYHPRYVAPRAGFSLNIGPLRLSASHVQRCEDRFRSYHRESDTYMGYDGNRHRCTL